MLSRMPTGSPVPSLTGLRFVAAMCVVVPHALLALMPFPAAEPVWYTYLTQASAIGMTLFFVLSGFVIHYNYAAVVQGGHWCGLCQFFVARFARLYPLYILLLSVVLATTWWHGTLQDAAAALPTYLLLMQTWTYAVIGGHSLAYQYGYIVPVTWSISTEWFFYLAYPAICAAVLRLRGPVPKLAAGVAVSAVMLVLLLASHADYEAINRFAVARYGAVADIHTHWQDCFIRWIVYFSPYSRLGEFILGCLTAALFQDLQARPVSKTEGRCGGLLLGAALLCMAALYQAMFGPPYSGPPFALVTYLHLSFGFAPCVAVIIFCCSRYRSLLATALSRPLTVRCGEISYSVYLLHLLAVRLFVTHALPVSSSAAAQRDLVYTLAAISVTIGASFVSYTLWEAPMRRLIRRAYDGGVRRARA